MSLIYGICRVSTPKQNIERQVRNIKAVYPNAYIVKETYTGTKLEGRKEFENVLKKVKPGDTLVFDSVSRMSRNAEEGFNLYKQLFNDDVELVFLKEPHINTSVYRNALANTIEDTGNDIADIYIEATNKVLLLIAEQSIKLAFEQSQKEVDDLSQRTKEGLITAKLNGKTPGRKRGTRPNIKKEADAKREIQRVNKAFGGQLNDNDTYKHIGISKGTFYKYKKQLLGGYGNDR